ncbi:MAG TPA: multicopper oxidase family protein [Steroidobacteraceae bacterium]
MISRRDLLMVSGLVGLTSSFTEMARGLNVRAADAPDYTIDIAPLSIELSPRHKLTTTAYNGQVPGPLLRFKENQPIKIDVFNRTDRPEVVHWHGLDTPPEADGAVEEGTLPIAPNSSARYTFTPRPSGFRWYHTHTMAMNDFTRAQYSGQHGFLMIEPRQNSAPYDQEFFLALHDWQGYLLASDDGAMNPSYAVSTINGKAMGSGEPLRVKQGQRILLHVLNSSPTEVHWIALSGHSFRVVALDGNPVSNPKTVPMLRLAPAERVCALVEMDNPGVWVLGEVRKHVQALGMAIAVEYAGKKANPQWQQPAELIWNYEQFAGSDLGAAAVEPATLIPLVFESTFQGHGAMEKWTINGASYPTARVAPLVQGRRYRLQFINKSVDDHPLHLHRHSFELRRLRAPLSSAAGAAPNDIRGIVKDVVLVDAQTRAEVEFTANNPGASLFHCHQQNHMDLGFMMLFTYA